MFVKSGDDRSTIKTLAEQTCVPQLVTGFSRGALFLPYFSLWVAGFYIGARAMFWGPLKIHSSEPPKIIVYNSMSCVALQYRISPSDNQEGDWTR